MTPPWQDVAMLSGSLLMAAIMWGLIDALGRSAHLAAVVTACL